jgi:hypothetical protein
MNRFEQLIEYVINDEEAKARELFHEIVVEKSRQIYEDIMSEENEDLDEAKDEDLDEAKDEDLDEAKDEDLDEAMVDIGNDMGSMRGAVGEAMGGDSADDLIDDVEMEEESDINMEADDEEIDGDMDMGNDMGDDHHADVGGEEELEDRVMDLEDKLDELMAEFEELMGDGDMGDGDMMPGDEGSDAIEVDDTEVMEPMPAMEAVTLKAAPKPVTSEEGSVNKKSVNADNAGAKGPVGSTVKPVKTGTEGGGHHDAAPYKNTTKDLIGKVGNTPAQGTQQPKPAPKPHLSQATGVNVKSPLPHGTKG